MFESAACFVYVLGGSCALERAEKRTMFQAYQDNGGLWRWRFVASNNRTLADSGESYSDRLECEDAIAIVKRAADRVRVRPLRRNGSAGAHRAASRA